MKKKIILALIFFWVFPGNSLAAELPTVTIVNPIRGPQLGLEKQDLVASLKSQWQNTRDASASATWLWQFSALENEAMMQIAKQEMISQEHGVFLEIDRNTAEKSGLGYKGRNQWYHSDGLLLVSYDPGERRKIIDTTFTKFKQVFGYYPSSVGAWWVGAEAIGYMKQKYGVNAVLQCADQFATDAYSIWGTPWSIPYLSRHDNAAVPAAKSDDGSGAVVMQWAPRDPNRAYGDSVTHSTYSMQDLSTKSYDLRYVEYLQNIFLKKSGDQVVFGLEGGLMPEGYQSYGEQVRQTKTWETQNKLKIQTMQQYAEDFLGSGKVLPPTSYFLAKDYENNNQAFWYNSPQYRLGLQKVGKKIHLIDVRNYSNTFEEDFNVVPNVEKLLRIETRSIIDSVRFPDHKRDIAESELPLELESQEGTLLLRTGSQVIGKLTENSATVGGVGYTFLLDQSKNEIESLRKEAWWLMKQADWEHDYGQWKEMILTNKKAATKLVLILYLAAGVLTTIIVLSHQNNTRLATLIFLVSVMIPTWQVYAYVMKPINVILTEYESQALRAAVNTEKNIAYLEPEPGLDFRGTRPFLYDKPALAEKLTKRKWTYQRRNEGTPLDMSLPNNTVLIVPRYTGQDLYQEELPKFGLRKIYDNAQIVLYTNN